METVNETSAVTPPGRPWNKGKLIGPKPPLQPKHVWAHSDALAARGAHADLALFNLAIDSTLRGCDVVSLKVENVAPHGYTMDRATIRQSKTVRPVRFESTEQTRQAIDEHLSATQKHPGDFLFGGRGGKDRCLSTRHHARLLSQRIVSIGLDPSLFGTHSLRRIKGTLIYRRTAVSGPFSCAFPLSIYPPPAEWLHEDIVATTVANRDHPALHELIAAE